jgi:hypothetical protein
MNKTKVLLAIGISVLLALPIIGTIDYKNNKGDYEMATITPINNGDSAGSARSKINTNFINVNTDLSTLSSTKITSIYGELSNAGMLPSLSLPAFDSYSFTSGLSLRRGSGINYSSNALQIVTSGTYLVTYSASLTMARNGDDLEITVLKNGTALTHGQSYNTNFQANTARNMFCSFIETFAANDLIKLGFKCSIPSASAELDYYYLTITKV